MKIYVWSGDRVLKHYHTGQVVIAANSKEEALAKLRVNDVRAWAWLQLGTATCFDEADLARHLEAPDDWDQEWVPPQPQEYTVETLPVLVMQGSE